MAFVHCKQCGEPVDQKQFLQVCAQPSLCWQRETRGLPARVPPDRWPALPTEQPGQDVARQALEVLKRGIIGAAQEPEPAPRVQPKPAAITPVPKPAPMEKRVSRWDVTKLTPEEMLGEVPVPPPEVVAAREMKPSQPAPEAPKAKPEPVAQPKPVEPPQKRKYAPRVRKSDPLSLARKMGHWLIDHGGTHGPIASSRMHRALTLARYATWREALGELVSRRIVEETSKGLLVIRPEKLLALDMVESRKKVKRKRRRRPKSEWYLRNVEGKKAGDEDRWESAEDQGEPTEDEGQD